MTNSYLEAKNRTRSLTPCNDQEKSSNLTIFLARQRVAHLGHVENVPTNGILSSIHEKPHKLFPQRYSKRSFTSLTSFASIFSTIFRFIVFDTITLYLDLVFRTFWVFVACKIKMNMKITFGKSSYHSIDQIRIEWSFISAVPLCLYTH